MKAAAVPQGLEILPGKREDVPLILDLIRELADYEKLLDQVTATQELLEEWLFEKRAAQVLIARVSGEPVGFALFFRNFSTFLGKGGIYLEDLYVRPAFRGKGVGKSLLRRLAALALEEGCGRLEWWCLDWNQPSIRFYRSLGAEAMEDWTIYRVAGKALEELAKE
jgi:GNAT superfamily N-acetyltransferase